MEDVDTRLELFAFFFPGGGHWLEHRRQDADREPNGGLLQRQALPGEATP